MWEITGAEFSKSEAHTADGISIRFPRCTRIRDDKDWKSATNLPQLKVAALRLYVYSPPHCPGLGALGIWTIDMSSVFSFPPFSCGRARRAIREGNKLLLGQGHSTRPPSPSISEQGTLHLRGPTEQPLVWGIRVCSCCPSLQSLLCCTENNDLYPDYSGYRATLWNGTKEANSFSLLFIFLTSLFSHAPKTHHTHHL